MTVWNTPNGCKIQPHCHCGHSLKANKCISVKNSPTPLWTVTVWSTHVAYVPVTSKSDVQMWQVRHQLSASSHLAGALCFLLTFTSNQDEAGHAYCNLKHINVNISCAHLRAPSSQSYLAQRASVWATNKGANFSFWPTPTENKVWLFLKTVANINTFINGLIFNQCRSLHAESLAILFCPVPFMSFFSTFLVRVRW